MYCPKCGETLTRSHHGELACEPGEMGLSLMMEQALTEIVENSPRETDSVTYANESRPWFCPRCRGPLATRELQKSCPQCGVILPTGVVYNLIERHPHKLTPVEERDQHYEYEWHRKWYREVGIKQYALKKARLDEEHGG